MGNISVSELAQSWYQSRPTVLSGDLSRNKLFQMLYNAYCNRNGIDAQFSGLADHHKACAELYRWYDKRYRAELKMPTGSQGQKRVAGLKEDEYTFDRLYCDDRQFKNYLLAPLPQSGSQDLLAFVLHTAVAFLVPLEELDEVLQHLGFHPLHVKNIHHLSIAYVLLMKEKQTVDAEFNPFSEVRRLYFKALVILEKSDEAELESYSYADQETRMIRNILLQGRRLASENFEALVARNQAALNMRHSLILSDFHKLSAVFIHIFDSNADSDSFDFSEEAYSFYHFVLQFCKEDLSRKKFREQLTSMIDLRLKHPTRNVLTLLWLYTYCFAFLPGIIIDKTTFRRIAKQLKKTDPNWEKEAKLYYQDDLFDVYGFITNQPERTVPQTFRGADFFTFINETLLLRYGWGPLNDKLPFDHYIHDLKHLTLRLDHSGCCIGANYGNRRLVGLEEDVDNVPFPLVAVTQIFEHLTQLHIQKAAQYKYEKLSPCPLKCGLYEQL